MDHHGKMKPKGLPKLFTAEGKPIRVLSTSLGIALLANAVISSGVSANGEAVNVIAEPKLVAWSTEEVKSYFDKRIDWSLPPLEALPGATGQVAKEEEEEVGAADGAGAVHHYHSVFGWDDLLLYHLLFNRGSSYSSSHWHNNHKGYYTGTTTRYMPSTYTSDKFQNKQVAGSAVRPKTSSSSGTVTRRSTSSSAGSIGGRSSGMSSSGSSTSSGSSSSGFGG
jgi:uncharacterized membrane protein YgcG